MAQTKKLRTAVVGCGYISVIHLDTLKALSDIEIVAICDLNEQMARERAEQHGIAKVFTNIETMMREVQPDVVHLLTPPRSRVALAKIVAKYKAHMYIEKPLASNEADARAILEMARDAGVHVCPGHSLLFDPPFLEACRRIRAGQIGRIISIRVEQGFTYDTSARSAVIPWSYTYDWGIFEDLMTHPLYLASHFLKEPGPLQVVGFNLGRVCEVGVEEIRVLIPSSGAVGEVALSLCNSPECHRLEVVGTQGRITVDFMARTVLSSRQSALPGFVTRFTANFSTALKLTWSSLGVIFGIGTGKIKRYMGLRALVAEFYRCLRAGSAPPVLPEDGLLNVCQMDQIKRACQSVLKHRTGEPASSKKPSEPRVLVTGASGFLGGRLVERLSDDGVAVRATTRLLSRARSLSSVHWIQCNINREDELRRALSGVETVFHCAAMSGPPGSLEEYEEANIRGTIRLTELAAEAGVKNLIYVSSLSVYGGGTKGPIYLDETAPYEDRAVECGVYTQSKLGADKALLEYISKQNGQPVAPRIVILRPGAIYGPGAKLSIGRFQLPFPIRQPVIAGGRRVSMPLVYVDNVIDAMLAAAQSGVPTGSVYNVVDSAEIDQGEVSRILREVSGGRIRPLFLPYSFVWTMMLGIDLLSLVRYGKLGTARFRLKRTLADMRFKCAAARKDLGWEPRISLTEGLTLVLSASTEIPFPH